MDKDVIEMMEKFDEKVERAKELRKVSNPEITENGENNIQELTSEQLKLKMRIERVQEGLEEYKKEDDYLGKSEYQRKIAEKEYTDRIEELKNEESKSLDNLKKAKEELERQRSIEAKEKSILEEINDFGTTNNIRRVKDTITDIENQINQAQIDSKRDSNKISVQMEEKNMKISQLEKARQRLKEDPSWNQTKYDEYTNEIDSLKNELDLLEQMQQKKEDKRNSKIEKLVETKTKFENFAKRLEYIFYGKDILKEEEKEENNQTKPIKVEETNNEETKQAEQPTTDTEFKEETKTEKEEPSAVTTEFKEEAKTEKEEPSAVTTEFKEEAKTEKEEPYTITTEPKEEATKNEEKSTQENAKKAEIVISAKNDEVLVNGKAITNMGIAKSYADRKDTFKKLNINAEIRKDIGKSFILKRIFVDPIIIAKIKSKMDPTIVQLIDRQENEEESTKIGEAIGLSIADYIKSIRTKEELPVDLTYDLKGSKFDNEELKSVENQMQKYARYADQITGVQVNGLKNNRSLFERLSAGLKTSGLIEEHTMADKMEQHYQSTERNIEDEEKSSFRDEIRAKVTNQQEKTDEPEKDNSTKEEEKTQQEER